MLLFWSGFVFNFDKKEPCYVIRTAQANLKKKKTQTDPTSTDINFLITFPHDVTSNPLSQGSSVSVVTELHDGRPWDRFWISG
jgi:hypothetical protein